jgi:site-specific DNA recombinase
VEFKVAIYIRVGRDGQQEAFENQKTALTTFAETSNWNNLKIFSDIGFGGGSHHRPGLESLIAHVKSGKFNAVLVGSLDRFTRSTKDLSMLLETLNRNNVRLITPKGEVKCELPFTLG